MTESLYRWTENERKRLSRMLHDDVVQRMMNVVYQADLLDIEPEKVEVLAKVVADVTERLRQIVHSLYPDLDDEHSLVSAIRRLPTGGARLEVDIRSDVETILPPASKRRVYRIVQEAVYDAAHCAGAREIAVSVWLAGVRGVVVIEVADDGSWPAAVRQPETLGERLEMLGCRVHIQSNPDRNAHVALIFLDI